VNTGAVCQKTVHHGQGHEGVVSVYKVYDDVLAEKHLLHCVGVPLSPELFFVIANVCAYRTEAHCVLPPFRPTTVEINGRTKNGI